jgi:antitoxin ParD1/3/4
MEIPLNPKYETLVRERVGSGRYKTAGEVVEEGLRLLQEQEDYKAFRLSHLKNELKVGLDQIERGEVLSEDEVFGEFGLTEDN